MNIRSFAGTDSERVIALWQDCGLVRPWNDPARDIQRKLAVKDDLFLVAESGDTIHGTVMAGYEGHRGWINYLAVAPEYRGKGLGRQLMQEAESRLLALNCPKINLQVRQGNDAVLAFYESIGFSDDQCISMGKRLIPDH